MRSFSNAEMQRIRRCCARFWDVVIVKTGRLDA